MTLPLWCNMYSEGIFKATLTIEIGFTPGLTFWGYADTGAIFDLVPIGAVSSTHVYGHLLRAFAFAGSGVLANQFRLILADDFTGGEPDPFSEVIVPLNGSTLLTLPAGDALSKTLLGGDRTQWVWFIDQVHDWGPNSGEIREISIMPPVL